MARRGLAVTFGLFLVLSVVTGHSGGRKILQSTRSTTYAGAGTAALDATAANIQRAVAISDEPGTSAVQAVLPTPRNPDPKQTSKGTAGAGKQEAKQAAAQAKIQGQASGAVSARPAQPAPKASDVPKMVEQNPSGLKTANTGRATSLQTTTAAGIQDAIARQEAVAAVNAQPGPNVPSKRP